MPLASQKSVDYSQGGDACDFCMFFVEDGQPCQKVQGPIYEDMWCKLFKRSEGETERENETAAETPRDARSDKHVALILIGKPKGA